MGIRMSATYLEFLRRVVARKHRGLVLAWIGVELSAIDLDGLEDEGTVGEFFKGAVLPLHYAFWTSGFLGCWGVSRCVWVCAGAMYVRFAMAR